MKGVLVESVANPNTPGAKAGLKPGDVITKFNGEPVSKSTELQRAVSNSPVGSAVTVTVIRDGQPVQLKAVLEELPEVGTVQANQGGERAQGGPTKGGTAFRFPA